MSSRLGGILKASMNKSESVIIIEITIRKRKDIFEGWGLGVAGVGGIGVVG